MIKRVWGTVNGTDIEFHPIKNRRDYYEGFAPRMKGLQEIEIWAENDKGAKGHLQCQVLIEWVTITEARLILAPFYVHTVPYG